MLPILLVCLSLASATSVTAEHGKLYTIRHSSPRESSLLVTPMPDHYLEARKGRHKSSGSRYSPASKTVLLFLAIVVTILGLLFSASAASSLDSSSGPTAWASNILRARKGGGGGHGGGGHGSGGRGGGTVVVAPRAHGTGDSSVLTAPQLVLSLALLGPIYGLVLISGAEAARPSSTEVLHTASTNVQPLSTTPSEHHLEARKGGRGPKPKHGGGSVGTRNYSVPKELILVLALVAVLSLFRPFCFCRSPTSRETFSVHEAFKVLGLCFNGVSVVYSCDCATHTNCIPDSEQRSGSGRSVAPIRFAFIVALGVVVLLTGKASATAPTDVSQSTYLVAPGLETNGSSSYGSMSLEADQMSCITLSGAYAIASIITSVGPSFTQQPSEASSDSPTTDYSSKYTTMESSAAKTLSVTSKICVYGSGWANHSAGATADCNSVSALMASVAASYAMPTTLPLRRMQ